MNNIGILDLYEKSNNEIAIELGRRYKDYRIAMRLTQKDIAVQSGVSVMTIVRFENGECCSIRLDNLIALLRAVQRLEGISEMVPDIPRSLYEKISEEKPAGRRVRRQKNEK